MRPGDVYWAASDIGWVVGHSYIVYAPLLHGCTTMLYEGKPVGTPDAGAFWRVCADHGVNAMFTAPTAIRAIKREDPAGELVQEYDLSAFRTLFLAGERCDPDTLEWASLHLERPVIDHWWQTESGWPMAANCVGLELLPVKPGSPTKPVPGYDICVLDENGGELPAGETGAICVRLPLPPGFAPTLWRGEQRFVDAYLSRYEGFYLTGDAGYFDDDGYLYVMSRIDDVINTAGHRLSTGQMEEVLASHSDVAECAVVGVADEFKGQVPIGFAVLKAGVERTPEDVAAELVALVRERVGSGGVIQDRGDRRRTAEDALRQDAARHHPQDGRRRGMERSPDDRGCDGPRGLRETAADAQLWQHPGEATVSESTPEHNREGPPVRQGTRREGWHSARASRGG